MIPTVQPSARLAQRPTVSPATAPASQGIAAAAKTAASAGDELKLSSAQAAKPTEKSAQEEKQPLTGKQKAFRIGGAVLGAAVIGAVGFYAGIPAGFAIFGTAESAAGVMTAMFAGGMLGLPAGGIGGYFLGKKLSD